jgi:hypothetical protein
VANATPGSVPATIVARSADAESRLTSLRAEKFLIVMWSAFQVNACGARQPDAPS